MVAVKTETYDIVVVYFSCFLASINIMSIDADIFVSNCQNLHNKYDEDDKLFICTFGVNVKNE